MRRVIFASILFLSTQILFSQSALEYWNMGQEAQRSREYEKAIEYYEKAGEIWLREGVYKSYLVALGNVGVLYKTLGKYELSLDTFFKLYIAAQEIGGQSEVSYSLQNIGLVFFELENWKRAVEYLEKALAIDREVGDMTAVSNGLHNIGSSYHKLKQYERAIEYYEESLRIKEVLGEQGAKKETLLNLGSLYDTLNDYKKAAEFYKKALALFEQTGNTSRIMFLVHRIGAMYHKLEMYEEALEYYERSLQLEMERGNRVAIASNLNNIGSIYYALGDYESALEYYEKGLSIDQELGIKFSISTSLSNIGNLYNQLGEYPLALEYYQRALTINEVIGEKIKIANNLNNIGMVFRVWGKYDQAAEYYKRALVVSEDAEDYNMIAISLSNLGTVYCFWGKYDIALTFYNKSLSIKRELGKKAGTARSLNNIGVVYQKMGDYDKAIEYFSLSLSINKELGKKAEIAANLNNIGTTYLYKDEYSNAFEYFKRSLNLEKELGRKSEVARALNNIGEVYKTNRQFEEALKYYKPALSAFKEIDRKTETASIMQNIGLCYYFTKEYPLAVQHFREAIKIIEEIRLTAHGELRRDFLSSQIKCYQALVAALLKSGDTSGAFEAAEHSKGRYLAETIGDGLNLNQLHFRTADAVRETIMTDEAVLVYTMLPWTNGALFCITGGKIKAIELDVAGFLLGVESKFDKDIEFILGLTRGFQTAHPPDTKEDNSFADIISYYLYLLTRQRLSRTEMDQRKFIARELYALLVDPVFEDIAGKTKLTIVPDGVLAFLPFETLLSQEKKYMVEDFTIQYTQSLAVSYLVDWRYSRIRRQEKEKPLVAFGGAKYESPDSVTGGQGHEERSPAVMPATSGRGIVSDKEINYAITKGAEYFSDVYHRLGLRWSDLPGTLEEVREIGALFPESTVYTGTEVTEDFVKRLSTSGELKQYDVLHFSTHGMVVPEYPELSALVLSQIGNGGREDAEESTASKGASGEDGYLCMAEIADLDIEAEFVNLSACDTGLGKIYAGEGVVGLTQSFLIAGAKGLSVSLWKVADESTKDFMVGMYRLVKEEGLSYPEAIRQMKLEFFGGAAYGGKYKNPFYWAPFVYYGE